ncbi:MAG: HAD hydrolase-like protein [Bacteroidetes bacterium]|nr:HAD hydrolase-like protein [Rhodothermia bacterium]MCS7154187.1 HAD hydrolase-like protein [Bacteroidota bacterium]MCX7906777.1 HAD hydrolase-like protein [Bacteroidota bacterium]MDW8136943.1 HAD hydrolase-like protein [Bacteroidota bacterium]MDW8285186.1 HAD hydrolase-like protein [Bacteroidota bacterium]
MKRLILFDIDGTLLRVRGRSRPLVETILQEVFGRRISAQGYAFAGKTDPQIFRDLARLGGVPEEEIAAGLPEALRRYLVCLAEELRPEHVEVLPGVRALLEGLRARTEVLLGLLTGNLEAGARLKLAAAGLLEYFPRQRKTPNDADPPLLGAFGSDDAERDRLLPIAWARAAAYARRNFTAQETLLVGDTEYDVRCGLPYGVRVLAVATGPYGAEALRQVGAWRVLERLEPPEVALAALLDGTPQDAGL